MSDSRNCQMSFGEALDKASKLVSDREVLHSITSHLTAREVIVIADLFKAAGDHATHRRVMEGIIHGDEEVRAVVAPGCEGVGTCRVEYFNDFLDAGVEDEPIYVRMYDHGGLRAAMSELMLEIDTEHLEWAAMTVPGLLVLDSAIRG